MGRNSVFEQNAAVIVYHDPHALKAAVIRLQNSGFEMDKLSVIGTDDQQEGCAAGYYTVEGRMRCWGERSWFWSGIWDLLRGWAFFSLPGIGPVLVAGPVAKWIVAALQNGAIFTGFTALGAGLYIIGIPKESVIDFESAVRSGDILLVVYGSASQVTRAREALLARAASA